jgi:hypothetical protein
VALRNVRADAPRRSYVVSRSYEAVQEAATGLLSWRDSLQRCVAYAHMCALLWLWL